MIQWNLFLLFIAPERNTGDFPDIFLLPKSMQKKQNNDSEKIKWIKLIGFVI